MRIDRLGAVAVVATLTASTALAAPELVPPELVPQSPANVADSIVAAKVDRLFAPWDRTDTPGAAVLVMRGGRVVYREGFGRATMEYDVPITPETVFHVASVSKQFTAFAIALLEASGKLAVDDDVRKYLPEVPDFGNTITLRHLIYHTSGLRDQWELLILGGWRMDDVITDEHILTMVRHQRELNFEPGTRQLYCNTGYTLLAEIVHRVTGRSFADWTREHIFEPLGMTSTHFHDDHERIVENRAYSYQPTPDGGFKKSVLNFANVGATSLFTTVDDLAKWMYNFDRAAVGNRTVIERMHEEGHLDDGEAVGYAFGLALGEHRGLRTVGHGGSDAGFRTTTLRFPDQDLAVVVLSNVRGVIDTGGLARRVAELYLADELGPEAAPAGPAGTMTASITPEHYDQLTGAYLFDNGRVMAVANVGGRLVRRLEGFPEVELVPLSGARFTYANRDLTVEFARGEDGEFDRLHIPDRDSTGRKFEPWRPGREELAEYVGEYASDEVGTTYSVAVADGRLVLRHRKSGDWPLDAVDRDRFSGQETVEFVRDDGGKVVRLLISTGRVKNLRFERVHPVVKRRR